MKGTLLRVEGGSELSVGEKYLTFRAGINAEPEFRKQLTFLRGPEASAETLKKYERRRRAPGGKYGH